MSPSGRHIAPHPTIRAIVISATLLITVHHYLVTDGWLQFWFVAHAHDVMGYVSTEAARWLSQRPEWVANAGWAVSSILLWGAVPLVATTFLYRLSPEELGLRRPVDVPWSAVSVMVACLSIAILAVHRTENFQSTYPFFKTTPVWPDWILFEVLYVLQFISLEFFFRGALLHTLEKRVGVDAIWLTTLPYVMVHFQKPWMETAGALIAGAALGYLSLRTRSIWPGAALHALAALFMDLLSLSR